MMHVSPRLPRCADPGRSTGPRSARFGVVAFAWLIVLSCHPPGLASDADEPPGRATIEPAVATDSGVLVHRVESPYQSEAVEIRVLVPKVGDRSGPFAVVYLLPVEARRESRYGDALTEVLKHDLHNKHRVICVQPTFALLPWYADHPTRRDVRQESHFVNVVVPFVDRHYPTPDRAAGRRLVGFSKSGWGALCLLTRHPETFGAALAWDAPLMMDAPGRFGSGPIFGTDENFQRYHLSQLWTDRADRLRAAAVPRLAILGYGGFRDDHQRAHALLKRLGVPHVYRDGPQREHNWHSGWLAEAFEFVAPVPSVESSQTR